MATAGIAGRRGRFYVGATSSGLSLVGEIRNYKFTATHRPIDATSNDSSGWDEFIKGQQGWTMTAEAIYLSTETDQKVLRKMFSTSGSKAFRVWPSTSQTGNYRGTGWLESFDVGAAHDAVVITNVSIRGTRAFTYTT